MRPTVFIEYHPEDLASVRTFVRILNENEIQVKQNTYNSLADYKIHADNILKESDFIIWILSNNTVDYKFLLWYSSAISELEIDEDSRRLMLPVFIDVNIQIPDFLSDRVRFIIKRDSPKEKYDDLIQTILRNAGQRFFNKSFKQHCKIASLQQLHQAYMDRNLTIFCGAGISMESGIPSWNELLVRCFLRSSNLTSSYTNVQYEMLSKKLRLNQSILARMIKNANKKNFYKIVHQILYEDVNTEETNTITAIMNLCEPSKNGGIKSIVTYNFDNLLETNFEKRGIKHHNGTNVPNDHLPIYHVHGFLPRNFDENENYHLVFSEDEYHEQYLNPYTSSTLKQMNALSSNICLYVGISFTDPNMRRLADFHIKECPENKAHPRHFLIKQKPQIDNDWKHCLLSQNKILEQIMFLEELDAESFGFRIIWIDDFNEISGLLNHIKNGYTEKS